MGSGSVINATSSNYIHRATAGQTAVGMMQGANNLLLSGFWLPQGLLNAVDQPEVLSSLPTVFRLHQNYPNPFNPQTTIQYDLPEKCQITVEIFNIVGQRIRLLISEIQGPGIMHILWNGKDDSGVRVSSGIYLCRLYVKEAKFDGINNAILFQDTKKLLFVE